MRSSAASSNCRASPSQTISLARKCRSFATCGSTSAARCPRRGVAKPRHSTLFSLPVELQTALEALYGHYAKTYALWEKEGGRIVADDDEAGRDGNASKLVYDFISGFQRENDDGSSTLENGR